MDARAPPLSDVSGQRRDASGEWMRLFCGPGGLDSLGGRFFFPSLQHRCANAPEVSIRKMCAVPLRLCRFEAMTASHFRNAIRLRPAQILGKVLEGSEIHRERRIDKTTIEHEHAEIGQIRVRYVGGPRNVANNR